MKITLYQATIVLILLLIVSVSAAPTISGGVPINASHANTGGSGGGIVDTSWNASYYLRDTSRSLTGTSLYRDVTDDVLSIYGSTAASPYGAALHLYGEDAIAQSGGAIFSIGNAAGDSGVPVWSVLGRTDDPYLDLNSNQIKNLADPTNNQDAVTLAYLAAHGGGGGIVDTSWNTSYLLRSGVLPMTGNLSLGGLSINNVTNLTGVWPSGTILLNPNGGNIGINGNFPATALDVFGVINASNLFTNTSVVKVGISAGLGSSQTYQTAIGAHAGEQNTRIEQTAIGNSAGFGNTGLSQTAIGYYAGYGNSGDLQMALGRTAGYGNSGSTQTAIGTDAGRSNSGSYQVAYGSSAGYQNTGNTQTAIGYLSGYQNRGVEETAVGYYAGYGNTVDSQTAVGYYAGRNNTGIDQTALGRTAGYLNSGFGQTAIGMHAGRSNTGANETAIGHDAGRSNAGSNLTAIGFYSGYSNTGNDVVAIGYYAGVSNTQSNQLIIQNGYLNTIPLIQGDFQTGNVSIGTAQSLAKFQVNGSLRFPSLAGGTLTTDALGNVYVISDESLKTNITSYTGGLTKILGLTPIQYQFNNKSRLDQTQIQTGFSAQNLQVSIPESVTRQSDGNLAVNDKAIIATIVNAVKDLSLRQNTTVSSALRIFVVSQVNNMTVATAGDGTVLVSKPVGTDDSSVIQAAVDAVPQTGGVVYISDGIYILDAKTSVYVQPSVAAIKISHPVKITASPGAILRFRNGITVERGETRTTLAMFYIEVYDQAGNGVIIENLNCDGNLANVSADIPAGIFVRRGSLMRFRDNHIYNFRYPITGDSSESDLNQRFIITGNTIESSPVVGGDAGGISIHNGGYYSVISGNIIKNSSIGIFLDSTNGTLVSGNVIISPYSDGIKLYDKVYDCLITNNIIRDSQTAFGIDLETTPPKPANDRNVISGNILHNLNGGIWIDSGDSNVVEGNLISQIVTYAYTDRGTNTDNRDVAALKVTIQNQQNQIDNLTARIARLEGEAGV